jgi:hypothetical protein
VDHTVITGFQTIGSIPRLADDLAFENVDLFFEGMHVRADSAASIKLTDAKFLMHRSIWPIHDTPAAKPTADLLKGRRKFEIFLTGGTDDVS